jgi:hypothetical protein
MPITGNKSSNRKERQGREGKKIFLALFAGFAVRLSKQEK